MSTNSSPGGRFKKILVPIDGSDVSKQALPYALAFAQPDTEMLLLKVIPDFVALPVVPLQALPPDDSRESIRRDRQLALEQLLELAANVRDSGATVYPVAAVTVGEPAEEIVRFAIARDYDMIVMSTHGRGLAGRIVFGSVADEVARTSPIPVLVIRSPEESESGTPTRIDRLIVPLDGSEFSEQALPAALEIAKQLDIPIMLLSVIDLWGFNSPSVMYPAGLDPRVYETAMVGAEDAAEEHLAKVHQRLQDQGVLVTTRMMRGPVAPSIASVANAHDLIVMTSHGTSGFTRFFLGSLAEKLVRESVAPILLTPPTGAVQAAASPAASDAAVANG